MCNTYNAFENHAGQFDNEPYPNLLPATQLNVPLVQDEVLNGSEKDIGTIKQGMCSCTCMHNVDRKSYTTKTHVTAVWLIHGVLEQAFRDSIDLILTIIIGICTCCYCVLGLKTVTILPESHTSKSAHLSCSNGTSGIERSQPKSPTAHFPGSNGASATLTCHYNERSLLPEQGKLPVYIILLRLCRCVSADLCTLIICFVCL